MCGVSLGNSGRHFLGSNCEGNLEGGSSIYFTFLEKEDKYYFFNFFGVKKSSFN